MGGRRKRGRRGRRRRGERRGGRGRKEDERKEEKEERKPNGREEEEWELMEKTKRSALLLCVYSRLPRCGCHKLIKGHSIGRKQSR